MNEWLLNFDKLKDDDDWLMKLLSSNTSTLPLLSDKHESIINTYLLTNDFYTAISSNNVNIKTLLDEDPLVVITSLIGLRRKIADDALYLDEFKRELNSDTILTFMSMGKISSNVLMFDNVIVNTTTNFINLNKKIKDEIDKSSEFADLSNELKDCLIESTKSSMGWKHIDYKKHAMGSLIDFIDLSLSLLRFNTSSTQSKRINGVQFIANIFQPYFNKNEDNIIDIIKNTFYTQYEYEIPHWKGKPTKIDKNKINKFSNENERDTSLLYKLNDYFNEYDTLKMSGVSESLVILLCNIFNNTLVRLKYLYQELYNRINETDKIKTEKEKSVLKLSIKNAIETLEKNYKKVIQSFFDLNDDISEFGFGETNDTSLYPDKIIKDSKTMFRVLGGIKSIKKKEKCDRTNYPIVLKYNETNEFTGEIDLEQTRDRLIKMFINSDEYVGGIVLHNVIAPKTFNIITKFINKGIRSKNSAMKKIDNEFNKMIKGIKLNKVRLLANKLQSQYKKIMLQSNNVVRTLISKQIIDDIILKYKEYRDTELLKMKDYLDVVVALNGFKKKELDKDRKTKLLKLTTVNKKLLTEYFVIKNTSYVYKLLSINILKSLISFYSNKKQKLNDSCLTSLENGIQVIDSNFDKNKNVLQTKNLNNLEQMMKTKNININMSGGLIDFVTPVNRKIVNDKNRNKLKNRKRPLNKIKLNKAPKEIDEVGYSDYWKDIEYKKMGGKSIFIPYYSKNSVLASKSGFFNVFESAIKGKPTEKYRFDTNTLLEKIRHMGLIMICNHTSEITKPNEWRLFSKTFLEGLKDKSPGKVRKCLYNCIASQTDYLKNTVIWSRDTLMEHKILLTNICKVYGDTMLDCDIIISREELMLHLGFSSPAK
jgi:hypothetical protein